MLSFHQQEHVSLQVKTSASSPKSFSPRQAALCTSRLQYNQRPRESGGFECEWTRHTRIKFDCRWNFAAGKKMEYASRVPRRSERWITACGEWLAELAVTSGGDEGALKTCLSPRLFIRLCNCKVASCMQHFMYSIPMFPYRPVLF